MYHFSIIILMNVILFIFVLEIMRLKFSPPKITKILNGAIDKTKQSVDIEVRNLVGLSLSVHPKDPMIYYVSTDEGCIVKVSL